MAQDYYTLEEAASIVRMAPDDLKQLARKGELRSFQDRGTWRFRVQDIQELARARGVGSDPELVLGEGSPHRPTDSPAPRSPAAKSREAEVFDFDLKADDESIGVGKEFLLETPGTGSGRKQGGSKPKVDGPKSGPKSGDPKSGPKSPGPKSGPKSPGPKSPVPKPGSDSDVRLVAEGSDMDFQLALDSDAKLVEDSGPPPQVKQPPRGRTGTSGPPSPRPGKGGPPSPRPGQPESPKRRTGTTPDAPPVDSGVRLVPMDSDSDVRIVGAGSDESLAVAGEPRHAQSDSDIRLEKHQKPKPPSDEGLLTEEINLDEELRKEEAQRKGAPSKLRPRPQQAAPQPPDASPFELSEPDLNLPPDQSEQLPQAKSEKDSSSDFELTPAADNSPLELGSSDLDLTPAADASPLDPSSDEEFKLDLPEDDIGLGHLPAKRDKKGPDSGIRLDKPADSGISLEQGGEGSDEIEFELSLDQESTPRPQSPAAQAAADSDSEFELTLDAEDAKPAGVDSSDFELTLDGEESKAAPAPATGPADSDSEFELTLDDSGGLSPLEQDTSPQVKADSDEKDIFETDFEVPALEEDSGSEAVAMEDADTGLDSSDFDLEISQEDMSADESHSEVVALDEEEPAAPARRKGKKKPAPARVMEEEEVEAEAESEFDEFGPGEVEGEVEAEPEEEPARTVVKEKLLPAAPWGVMPVICMLLCVPVMIVVALLGFELVQGMNGHKSPGLVTRTLTNLPLFK
jgi:hypothetical protein